MFDAIVSIVSMVTANKLNVFNAMVCFCISFHGVCVINKMRRKTSNIRWLGYALLTSGAFAVAIAPVYGRWSTDPGEALMNIGLLIVVIHAAYTGRIEYLKEGHHD